MALIKFGGGITEMRGSIAGNVFARNRYGAYVRSRTKPVNPNSTSQALVRSAMSAVTEYWSHTVSSAERIAWATYAAAVAMKNKLGETIYLSGFNHFVRGNASRARLGLNIIAPGPTTLALPEKDTTIAITASVATQKISIAFDNTQAWATEADSHLLLFAGQPQQETRNFFAGPWKYAGKVTGVATPAPTSPAAIDSPYTLVLGQRVFGYVMIIRADGRVSEPMYVSCTVAA
jgi:hypothetical protein